MSDVTIRESRHRITYLPTDGEPMLLLDVGEAMDAAPALEGSPKTESTPLIGRAWAHHASQGNAEVTLKFDVHRTTYSPASAQAKGLEIWRALTTHPAGKIIFETAFIHNKSCPLIRWEMDATLISVNAEDLDLDTSAYEKAVDYHMSYEFQVSLHD